MKIKNENQQSLRCPKCQGDDFKPLGGDKYACLTCETPTTATKNQKEKESE